MTQAVPFTRLFPLFLIRLGSCCVLALGCAFASPAFAAEMCKTPDGFFLAAAKQQPEKPDDKGNGGDKNGRGMGGTGIFAETGGKGIGGTGIRFAEGGKGIGGTGINFHGSIIVKGRITGFGSICVNGLEVHYSKATPVSSAAGALTTDNLRIGEVVSILATPQQNGLQAQHISLDHILSGKVDSVNVQKGTAEIGGKTVMIGHKNLPLLPGDRVYVSGFKNTGGKIIATMIEKSARPLTPPTPPSSPPEKARHIALQGYITTEDSGQRIRVGDTVISIAQNTSVLGGKLDDINPNSRVLVFGDITSERHVTAEMIVIEHKEIETEISTVERETGNAHSREERSDKEPTEEIEKEREIEHQETEGIEAETSEIESPETEAPEVEAPESETPEMEAPEMEVPEIEAPEIETPEIEVPEVETPEVEPPEIELPETGG